MGRSFWFECSRCGYRATVSGGADRGRDLFVQTIHCRDCRKLYDAVTRLRVSEPAPPLGGLLRPLAARARKAGGTKAKPESPPSFDAALARLPCAGVRRSRWLHYKLQCPVSAIHRVSAWNEPDPCPQCGMVLEKNALPYRLWD
jgi:hypothetical protein